MHFCEQNQEKGCISDDHISHCLCFVPLQMLPLTNGLFGGHNCICMANLNQWPRRASLANVQKHCYNFLSLRVLFGSLWSSKQTKLMIISHHYSSYSCSLLQLASATLCLILLFRLCWHRVCLFAAQNTPTFCNPQTVIYLAKCSRQLEDDDHNDDDARRSLAVSANNKVAMKQPTNGQMNKWTREFFLFEPDLKWRRLIIENYLANFGQMKGNFWMIIVVVAARANWHAPRRIAQWYYFSQNPVLSPKSWFEKSTQNWLSLNFSLLLFRTCTFCMQIWAQLRNKRAPSQQIILRSFFLSKCD